MSGSAASAAEHQALLAESVAGFTARGTDIARVRKLRGTAAEYDRAVWTMEAWQRLAELLVEAGAEEGIIAWAQDVAGVETDFLNPYYYSRPATLYGGSSEIQRNILAQYVLKLPS